jgi:iron(III) transport system substrate-binding protein
MVNTNLLKSSEYPKSWSDLIDPRFKGEIILANPALSGSAYAQVYMLYKLYGNEFLAKLAKNAVFTASSTAGPESVARGEYAITVTGESNIGKYIGEGLLSPMCILRKEPALGLMLRALSLTAPILKQPNCSWISSPAWRLYEIIRSTRNRRVVTTELPGPENLPALSDIKLFPYDDLEAKNIKET